MKENKVMKELKVWATYFVILTVVVVGFAPTLQSYGQTRNRVTNDPRGLDRYTLTGETAPLSIFSLPKYNGRSDFFDGYGRKTAEDLGLTNAEFYNEFGKVARKGYLHDKAVIWFQNGFQWGEYLEGYLEGCTKAGKPFFNRVKIKVPAKPQVPVSPPKPLCVNIAIALEDVPSDWTKSKNPDGTYTCNWPVPEPVVNTVYEDREVPCKPGPTQKVLEHHDRKGFDPGAMIREKLTTVTGVAENMVASPLGGKVTSLFVYYNGCNVYVYVHSTIRSGLGWMVWLIPAAFVAGFVLGYFLRGGGKSKMVTPIKSTPLGGSPTPVRPRIPI